MDEGEEIIHNRKLILCPSTANWPVPDLLRQCPQCNTFLLYCCACNSRLLLCPESSPPATPCHHFRIVFTDGACKDNGQPTARAGVGIAYGNDIVSQHSIPITNRVDKFPLRSNQRAELCAAKLGLEFLAEANKTGNKESMDNSEDNCKDWIIATDSEYVVKGMTEWLPTWKKNDWRTSKGTKPINLDLFLALDGVVTKYEAMNKKIGFWHILRRHNEVADSLAKAAAMNQDALTYYGDQVHTRQVMGQRTSLMFTHNPLTFPTPITITYAQAT